MIVALLEFRDTSFRTESDVLAVLALPVLAVVPLRRRRRTSSGRDAGGILLGERHRGGLVASGSVFWYLQLWKFIM